MPHLLAALAKFDNLKLVENIEGENSKWLPVAMKLRFNRAFRIVTNKVKEFL